MTDIANGDRYAAPPRPKDRGLRRCNEVEYLIESGNLPSIPLPAIQKRYLRSYKDEIRQRQLISVEDAAKMVRAMKWKSVNIRQLHSMIQWAQLGM